MKTQLCCVFSRQVIVAFTANGVPLIFIPENQCCFTQKNKTHNFHENLCGCCRFYHIASYQSAIKSRVAYLIHTNMENSQIIRLVELAVNCGRIKYICSNYSVLAFFGSWVYILKYFGMSVEFKTSLTSLVSTEGSDISVLSIAVFPPGSKCVTTLKKACQPTIKWRAPLLTAEVCDLRVWTGLKRGLFPTSPPHAVRPAF